MDNILNLNDMPADVAACITRLHHRMQAWRTANPKADVVIFWREQEGLVVIATIRSAIKLGFCHVNQPGWDMLRAMCEPEKDEPTMNMVKLAIELNV